MTTFKYDLDITTYRVRVGLFGRYQLRTSGCKTLNYFDHVVWLSILLILAGDVHKNPGPTASKSNDTHTYNSFSSFKAHLSIVHYNIQSFVNKSDILCTELNHFDILAFSETRLDQSTSSSDLLFNNYSPFRQDRRMDRYGGIDMGASWFM